MKDFLNYIRNDDELIKTYNIDLIERNLDDDLVTYIVDAIKSLEVIENIKFLGYEYQDDESQIETSDYIQSRATGKDAKNKCIYLYDSRVGELTVKLELTCYDKKKDTVISKIIKKKILIPVEDENHRFILKGKKQYLVYQLVDTSTYNTKNDVVLKSFISIDVSREFKEIVDTDGEEYTVAIYSLIMFKKKRDIMSFYFAKMGATETLIFFNVATIITFVDSPTMKDPNFIYFKISGKLFIRVNRKMFEKYGYVKSIVGMILTICTNRVTKDLLYNKKYWVEKIGVVGSTGVGYIEKGYSTLIQLSRMLDETTKKVLRTENYNKENIYCILRWMIQNFQELRTKDNLDFSNKRLRYNEFISMLFTKMLSDRVNKLITKGKSVSMEELEDLFKFPGNIILTILYNSGLLRFDDSVNDLDFSTKLQFSLKGINSLGNKNNRTITKRFRALHPSHIGRVDINVVGNSDPFTSGTMVPTIKTDGLYLSDKHEPEEFAYKFDKDINELLEEDGGVTCQLYDDIKSFYNIPEDILESFDDIKIYRTSEDGKNLERISFRDEL